MITQKEKRNLISASLEKYPMGTAREIIRENEPCSDDGEMLVCELEGRKQQGSRHYVDEEGNHRSKSYSIIPALCYIFDREDRLIEVDVIEENRGE
ncbi:MAG: hypothetical protein GY754_01320 [bacterium]|nr:hypothetical protein [bacterium]